jgi:hypothetical protein
MQAAIVSFGCLSKMLVCFEPFNANLSMSSTLTVQWCSVVPSAEWNSNYLLLMFISFPRWQHWSLNEPENQYFVILPNKSNLFCNNITLCFLFTPCPSSIYIIQADQEDPLQLMNCQTMVG